jgi:hypothetical protein
MHRDGIDHSDGHIIGPKVRISTPPDDIAETWRRQGIIAGVVKGLDGTDTPQAPDDVHTRRAGDRALRGYGANSEAPRTAGGLPGWRQIDEG